VGAGHAPQGSHCPAHQDLKERGRNENPAALQYWKSVGVPAKGEIKDEDFTRGEEYLTSAGIIKSGLDAKKLYTNEYNGLLTDSK
jgi:hypothetical protein